MLITKYRKLKYNLAENLEILLKIFYTVFQSTHIDNTGKSGIVCIMIVMKNKTGCYLHTYLYILRI